MALAALVFPLLGVTRLIPWATALLAGCVLVASEHGDVGYRVVALSAAMVLLVAECASAAGDLRALDGVERGLGRRLVARIVVQSAAAAVLAAPCSPPGRSGIRADLATLALGLAAGVALLGLVTVVVTRR